jgi:heptosyltransferase-2
MLSILSMFGLKVSSDEIENWIQPKNPSLRQGFTQKLPKDSNQILISLGAGQFRRNWPIEKVSSLVDSFQISHPTHTVILLGPKSMMSKEIDNTFSNLRNVLNLIGKTSLQEVVFLMRNSKLLVSNDSGLVHIGASMKLPCVVISSHPLNGDLWHLHAPNRYHPWKTKYRVLQPSKLLGDCTGSCIADRPHCISSIPVADVHKACLQLLNPHF